MEAVSDGYFISMKAMLFFNATFKSINLTNTREFHFFLLKVNSSTEENVIVQCLCPGLLNNTIRPCTTPHLGKLVSRNGSEKLSQNMFWDHTPCLGTLKGNVIKLRKCKFIWYAYIFGVRAVGNPDNLLLQFISCLSSYIQAMPAQPQKWFG